MVKPALHYTWIGVSIPSAYISMPKSHIDPLCSDYPGGHNPYLGLQSHSDERYRVFAKHWCLSIVYGLALCSFSPTHPCTMTVYATIKHITIILHTYFSNIIDNNTRTGKFSSQNLKMSWSRFWPGIRKVEGIALVYFLHNSESATCPIQLRRFKTMPKAIYISSWWWTSFNLNKNDEYHHKNRAVWVSCHSWVDVRVIQWNIFICFTQHFSLIVDWFCPILLMGEGLAVILYMFKIFSTSSIVFGQLLVHME